MNRKFNISILMILFCVCAVNLYAKVGIIINKDLYPSISASIQTYITDLGLIEQKDVWLNATTFTKDDTPGRLKDSLLAHYTNDNLEGVIFIGDLPVAIYSSAFSGKRDQYPCDLYYMDLNGTWQESGGVFSNHTGTREPEIWMSRVTASVLEAYLGDDETTIVNDYFTRVRRRMRGLDSQERTYVIAGQKSQWGGLEAENIGDLGYDPGSIETYSGDTCGVNWKNALIAGKEYGFIYAHSSATFHAVGFNLNDIVSNDLNCRFFNVYGVDCGDYTVANLCGGYALSGAGLICVGSSKTGSMIPGSFRSYNQPLGQGKSFGEAFKDWFTMEGIDNISWHYGMNMQGVGTLHLQPYSTNPFLCITSPNGGEAWEKTRSYTIKYESNVGGNGIIEVLKGGSAVDTLANSVPLTGSFTWDIPAGYQAGTDYKIKISSLANDTVLDESDNNFSIIEEYIIATYPYEEDFDDLGMGTKVLPYKWEQLENDDFDWLVWTGPTPSKIGSDPDKTGPDGDHTSGSGNYIYVEASSPNNPDKRTDFITPKFNLNVCSEPEVIFWVHMFSADNQMGDLWLDIDVDGTWHNDVYHLANDHGDAWFRAFLNLSSYKGDRVRIRFRGVTGSGWTSDICIDDFKIHELVNAPPNDISVDNLSVPENSPGAVVGTVSVSDPNPGDTHTLTVDDNRFEIVSQVLKLKSGASLDHAVEQTVPVQITAQDNGGLSYSEIFTVIVIKDSIRVVSPNGGETLFSGTTTDITWFKAGSVDSVKILYSTNGGTDWYTVIASTANDSVYSWTVPSAVSSDCRIQISDVSDGDPIDESDAPFSITSLPTITVTSPNGGEILLVGSSYNITWAATGTVGNVKIEYSADNGTNWSVVEGNTENDGIYSWPVPQIHSLSCKIRISEASDGDPVDESDAVFSIEPEPTIVITSPNGGEVLTAQTTANVTWSSAGIVADVRILFSSDNGANWYTITAATPNDGVHPWIVPNSISTTCKIQISEATDGAPIDESDAVFIIAPPPVITVTAPNGSESWNIGSPQNITWTTTGTVGNVKIEYSTNGGSGWAEVVAGTANDGTHPWTIPDMPSSSCKVRVSDASDGSPNDESDAVFTIQPAPTLTVLTPNGGEIIILGTSYNITWSSTGTVGDVKIEYTTDNGSNWVPVIAVTANDGSHIWTVPTLVSTVCKVRISEASDGDPFDESNAVFTIDNQAQTTGGPDPVNAGAVFSVTPNPVPQHQEMQFQITPSNDVTGGMLKVYDPVGNMVYEAGVPFCNANESCVFASWELTNTGGRKVGEGIYNARLLLEDIHGKEYLIIKGIGIITNK